MDLGFLVELVVGGDFVYVVDDEGLNGHLLGDELEAELLLEGGKEVGKAGVGVVGGGVGEGEVVVAGQASFIDDGLACPVGENAGDVLGVHVPDVEAVGEYLREGLAIVFAGLEPGAAFGDNQFEAGSHFGFAMKYEMETLFQQALQHRPHLFEGELLVSLDFGGDVVLLRFHPAGHRGYVVRAFDVIGELNQEGERHTPHREEIGRKGTHGRPRGVSGGVGINHVDGDGFELGLQRSGRGCSTLRDDERHPIEKG